MNGNETKPNFHTYRVVHGASTVQKDVPLDGG